MSLHEIRQIPLSLRDSARDRVIVVRAGELELWSGERQAWAEGRRVVFSPREFELLFFLAIRERHVVSRSELYEAVWGKPMEPGRRDIDVHVRKIRRKLKDASPGWQYVHTHHALGYRFEAERLED